MVYMEEADKLLQMSGGRSFFVKFLLYGFGRDGLKED